MGDKGDNIPAIKDRVGIKTAIKIFETGQLDELLEDEEIKAKYDRNEKLISFEKIPVVLIKEIIRQYDESDLNEEPVDYFKWMVKHKLRAISENASTIIPVLNRLRTKNSEEGLNALF